MFTAKEERPRASNVPGRSGNAASAGPHVMNKVYRFQGVLPKDNLSPHGRDVIEYHHSAANRLN